MVTLQVLLLFAILSQALAEFKCYSQVFTAIEDITFDEKDRKPCKAEACFVAYKKRPDSQGSTTKIYYGCDYSNYCKGYVDVCLSTSPLTGEEITDQLCCCKEDSCKMKPFDAIPPKSEKKGSNPYSSFAAALNVTAVVAALKL